MSCNSCKKKSDTINEKSYEINDFNSIIDYNFDEL